MADINIGQITEALNNKLDRDGMNAGNPASVVVETYQNGTSWYRVYSDGWCEQGGYASATAAAAAQQITLLKNYASADYSVFITRWNANADSFWQVTVSSMTTSYFTTGYACNKKWYACGYIR